MDRRKTYFYTALGVTFAVLFLFLTSSSLLIQGLGEETSIPLGTLITWAGMVSLPQSVYWGSKGMRTPTTSLNRLLSTFLKILLLLGLLWVPLSFLLAGNLSFTFSEKVSFQGGQLAMKCFWTLSYGILGGSLGVLVVYWISLLFKRK